IFALPQVTIGVPVVGGADMRLAAECGAGNAKLLALTGRRFSAHEAERIGMVQQVVDPDDLLPTARALAREIADNTAPVSVALARQMMWRMLGAEHPMVAHRADSRGMLARGQSADAAEGIGAFLEKRPASFPDRVSDGLPDIFPGWTDPEFK
ncbi:MAG TPA: enoyl-CoA hydratase-related protein, partial [Solirubrobacteraceae bacterium]|nr:enoyl-CoA hydratase-related protein [Solirubrobacteraceae bacterium]